ncbi:MAG: MFS transporter, partial [Pseudonocardiaceae bacterium]
MTRPIMTGSGADPAVRNGAYPHAGASPAGVAWGLPLVVLVAGMFMSLLDTNIVNVAIPTIQKEFGATTDDVQW